MVLLSPSLLHLFVSDFALVIQSVRTINDGLLELFMGSVLGFLFLLNAFGSWSNLRNLLGPVDIEMVEPSLSFLLLLALTTAALCHAGLTL